MSNPVARSPRRRQLGALLRRVRKDAGLSGEALAKALGVSQSHLSRVELGDTAASEELVDRWVSSCGDSESVRREAAEMVELVTTEFTTWRSAMASGLATIQRDIAAAEAAANTICTWVPALVPGLMQTASYTRHLIVGEHPEWDGVAEAVAARMQRQPILFDLKKRLRWVIGEAGLRWRVAPPDVMAGQLDRLAMLTAESHLDVRILPFTRTASVWHDHGFVIRSDRTDGHDDVVNLELLTGPAHITEPGEVAEYKAAYERLAELALAGPEAVAFIRQVMAEMRDQ